MKAAMVCCRVNISVLLLATAVAVGYGQKVWGPGQMRGARGESGPNYTRRPPAPVAVDGGWGDWTEWTECSKPCGGGIKNRQRECDNPRPLHGGQDCQGLANRNRQQLACNTETCSVDGGWTDWSDWTVCSESCGGGTQTRERSCTSPAPSAGGAECSGRARLRRQCNDVTCAVHGGWSDWTDYGECSSDCAGGSKRRTRACTNPSPTQGGAACTGDESEDLECNSNVTCSVEGGWTHWGQWSMCSARCGVGVIHRDRSCSNPTPVGRGTRCKGRKRQRKECDTGLSCAVHGGWTRWDEWSSCDATCGGGQKWRRRSCTDPKPVFGGNVCDGDGTETASCNQHIPCPVNGAWAEWNDWTDCSAACAGGTKSRYRTCTDPSPEHGGSHCVGSGSENRECNKEKHCKVNGGWSIWLGWTACSVSCGGGRRTRQRTCSDPPPVNAGADCIGSPLGQQSCNDQSCRVDGGWVEWTEWSRCSVTCGQGAMTRTRSCTAPAPVNGGRECEGPATRYRRCTEEAFCPLDGGWGEWTTYSACPTSCGSGTQTRTRQCDNPTPTQGGRECVGRASQTEDCAQSHGCVVDGRWGSWSPWTSCSVSCGTGIQGRFRVCDDPVPLNGGDFCEGGSAKSGQGRNCDAGQCLAVSGWAAWGRWSACSEPCGGGTRSRTRTCRNQGSSHCQGSTSENENCNQGTCPRDQGGDTGPQVSSGWGRWSPWGGCSVTCGGGTRVRIRSCDNQGPGGCGDSWTQTGACNQESCIDNPYQETGPQG